MSGLKPLMRETREAVLKGAARAKDRLHQVADNMNDHVDDVARRVRAQDKFDDKPDMTPPAGRVLQLKYKKRWTPDQRRQMDAKVAELNRLAQEGLLIKTGPKRQLSGLRDKFAALLDMKGKDLPKDMDVDHIHELQLGGKDSVLNSWLLDSSVNRSTGSQIRQLIKGDIIKTPYSGVTVS